jgi:hypothetical protein
MPHCECQQLAKDWLWVRTRQHIFNNSPFPYSDLLIRICWHLISKGDETNWNPLDFTSISMAEKCEDAKRVSEDVNRMTNNTIAKKDKGQTK